jgi:molybdate transport system substrate-binding protein
MRWAVFSGLRRATVALVLATGAVGTALTTTAAGQPADSGKLAVFAAASLTAAFPKLNAHAEYSFAGSDQLAAQIQLGARVDVFAAASPKYPELLYQKGLCQKPVPFATNTLVLIVPKSNPAGIHSVDDLSKPGVKLVVGDPSVPVGSYTLTVLKNLGLTGPVLANVVSRETDVKGVVAKVALGEADAGFVYVTDVKPVRSKVQAIAIRESAQPHVVYEACVLAKAPHAQAAYRFLTALIRPADQRVLVSYGFGSRPRAS